MSQFYFVITTVFIFQIYSFFALNSLVKPGPFKWIFIVSYIALSILVFYSLYNVYMAAMNRNMFSSTHVNFNIGVVITAFVTLLFFGGMTLLHDIGRLIGGIYNFLSNLNVEPEARPDKYIPSRRKFITWTTAAIAAVPFTTLIYGITKGKYNYKVSNISLAFKDLPKKFDGFKIVQISDIHAGSLDNPAEVTRGVEMVNDQNPDLIMFTGDLVNSKKDEVDPYIEIFGKLQAKEGKYAVLGNHDYYGLNDLPDNEHPAYWEDFYTKYVDMGFKLLNNATATIEKEGEKIQITGVENWGSGRWFPKKGDLDKALSNVNDEDFTVLLSHDPTHWAEKVIPHKKNINLTLSGHTHGMQFGINMPGFKWSPAQMRYKHWMGLYQDKGQYLYVNRGFGFLAFPGRVGMWPEITVIELKSV